MNTTNTHNQILDLKNRMAKAIIGQAKAIIGQEHVIEQLLIALLANGHVLMEGLPGLAKTRTIKKLAANLESEFRRPPIWKASFAASSSPPTCFPAISPGRRFMWAKLKATSSSSSKGLFSGI